MSLKPLKGEAMTNVERDCRDDLVGELAGREDIDEGRLAAGLRMGLQRESAGLPAEALMHKLIGTEGEGRGVRR